MRKNRKLTKPSRLEMVFMVIGAFVVLALGEALPTSPTDTIPGWFMLLVLVGFAWLMYKELFTNDLRFIHTVIVFAVVIALLLLNSADWLPSAGPNPCPGQNVILLGKCW